MAHAAEKGTRNYDTECSNNHFSKSQKGTEIEPQQDKLVTYMYPNLPRTDQGKKKNAEEKLITDLEIKLFLFLRKIINMK